MASTSVTQIGKVMVTIQVTGDNEDSIKLQNSPPSTQAPAKTDKMNPNILQGEPQCLGVRRAYCFVC